MSRDRGILLTGATGLIGRYLLRELLGAGHRVGILVRDTLRATAAERAATLVEACREAAGTRHPRPVVLAGDLACPGLGLGPAERNWMARHCSAVIHSAAAVAFRATAAGEPWESNVQGTRRLVELCRSLGIAKFHHVSTAFQCGNQVGQILEDQPAAATPGNVYEESKRAAEQLLRHAPGIRTTIYRPSVVVGDSRTGFTSSYHHFYRFLEMAVRLATPARDGEGRPVLRVPLSGQERQSLVPVDWVARAVVRLVNTPAWHGRTFHLVAREPVRLVAVMALLKELLGLEGIEFVGRNGLREASTLEQLILDKFEDYWSYLQRDVDFDCRNVRAALPNLAPPLIDRDLVERLLHFAMNDRWGRKRGRTPRSAPRPPAARLDCGRYVEDFFPRKSRSFALTRAVPANLTVCVDVRGLGGGRWTCQWPGDGSVTVERGQQRASLTFRTDAATFDEMVRGPQSMQAAFFDGRVEIEGDMEMALKLATLFQHFVTRFPYPATPQEVPHELAGR